jgi:hypothetical protein
VKGQAAAAYLWGLVSRSRTGTHRELLKLGVPYDIDIDITSDALDEL